MPNRGVRMMGIPFEKTEGGYLLQTYAHPNSEAVYSWIERDMGPAVVTLSKAPSSMRCTASLPSSHGMREPRSLIYGGKSWM